jgi:O-antigen chain-terminating methyltransferase
MVYSPTIHVIGDSHTAFFSTSNLFTVHHIGPATCFNLKNKKSSNDSLNKLNDVLKITGNNNKILMVLGEIDCRIHIYYQYKKNEGKFSISELIDRTIQSYGDFLLSLIEQGYYISVCGIVPVGTEENIYGYRYYATREVRSLIYQEFNSKLKSFCCKNNLKFMDIYEITSDEQGFFLPEYTDDGVHLNSKLISHIEQLAMDEFSMTNERLNNKSVSDKESFLFEIRDNEIDVEEIVSKIRNNIKKRINANGYLNDDVEKITCSLEATSNNASFEDSLSNQLDISPDIQNNDYLITSHRPLVGKFLVKGRNLVNDEVKRYVDPVFWKQTELNRIIIDYSNKLNGRIIDLEQSFKSDIAKIEPKNNDRIEQLKYEIDNEIASIRFDTSSNFEQLNSRIEHDLEKAKSEIDITIEKKLLSVISTMQNDIEDKAWLADILERRISKSRNVYLDSGQKIENPMNYFAFSEEIAESWINEGGNAVNTPNIYDDLISLFQNCNQLLEIGSGSGYFLKLLRDNNIGSYGIDINEDYILFCNKLGLQVQHVDALTHLDSINDKSIDGVFMGQVVEHLDYDVILDILKLCYEKLQFGSYIAISTPYILSVLVSTNLFYLDPTHKTHIHPEVIKFMLKSCGFRDVQEKLYQPVPDENKLKKIELDNAPVELKNDDFLNIMNSNVDKLNEFLFGHRDYLVIAKK